MNAVNADRSPAKLYLTGIILLVLLSFSSIIRNGFVSWDDEVYILNNPCIQTLGWNNLVHIFTSSFEGHYHPLTLISLATDYQLFGINPQAFHLHNLFLHLISIVLVFAIVRKFTQDDITALVTAGLFGLHPMHVEAVVWATARKDVLYAVYFLLSVYTYLLHKEKNKAFWYICSLILFILALFSKGQAVFLPLCLMIIRYVQGKSLFSLSELKDKIPYIVIAVVFGIIALISQQTSGYMGASPALPSWWKLILLASLSFWMYIYKLIIPISLSAYYPVPEFKSTLYLLLAIISLVLSGVLIYLVQKGYKKHRLYVGGILFFVTNLFIFLRWIPVSNYIIADRYTYISSIGLFLMAGAAISLINKRTRVASLWIIVVLPVFFLLGTMTYARTKVWKDTDTLIDDILILHPDVYPALNTRGNQRFDKGDVRGAIEDFTHAIEVQPRQSRAWANRASVYFKQGKAIPALNDINQAVALSPVNPKLLSNRGLMFDALGKTREALDDFNAAIKYDPYFAEAYNNRGMELARCGLPEEAMKDFDLALNINPSLLKAYANRGKTKNQLSNFKGAIEDMETAIHKGFSNPILFFDLGFAWYNMKDFYKAKVYFDTAVQLKPDYVNALTYRGYTQFNDGDFVSALSDLDKAISLDTSNPIAYGMRGMALVRLNRTGEACKDFSRAEAMGLKQVRKQREKYCSN